MELLFSPDAWIALLTLTVLEIVLGIDNIVFISILSAKLPQHQQARARFIGLAVAMISRIILLFSLSWIMKLTTPLFSVFAQEISGRDLILLFGGLFLIGKSTFEIHEKMELVSKTEEAKNKVVVSFASVIIQVAILDLVFSLDSVITAIGMTEHLPVMVVAIVIAVGFMMLSATSVSNFVDRHPTVKILALSFLILIGVALLGEGLDLHIPKGYIYFAMAFSVLVEMLNLRLRGSKTAKKA